MTTENNMTLKQIIAEERERFKKTFHTIDGRTIGVRAENYSTEHTWERLLGFLDQSYSRLLEAQAKELLERVEKLKINDEEIRGAGQITYTLAAIYNMAIKKVQEIIRELMK